MVFCDFIEIQTSKMAEPRWRLCERNDLMEWNARFVVPRLPGDFRGILSYCLGSKHDSVSQVYIYIYIYRCCSQFKVTRPYISFTLI